KHLSVEELMDIEVTSVSRRPEKVSETASAIQVITQEDIRRSGATSIPEALRLASNLEVAQVDSHQWAISARGFSNTTANKMLVMIDGRTVYTPLFSGVFWDVQDTLLEDVDRIEVISGPGATLWGANAVNGVINITTRSARDTQGSSWRVAAARSCAVSAARATAANWPPIFITVFMANILTATARCFPTATTRPTIGTWGRAVFAWIGNRRTSISSPCKATFTAAGWP